MIDTFRNDRQEDTLTLTLSLQGRGKEDVELSLRGRGEIQGKKRFLSDKV